jgi:hypothetical protein
MINQSVQIDTNQASSSGTHDEAQVQSQTSGSNQLPILQNLLALQEIIH